MKRLPVPAPTDAEVHRGRPRNAEPSSSVSTWLPAHEHDVLIRRARAEEISVSALVRRLVRVRDR